MLLVAIKSAEVILRIVNIVLDQVTDHIFRGQSLSVYCFINGYFYDLRAIRRGLCDFARVYTGNTVNIHFTLADTSGVNGIVFR